MKKRWLALLIVCTAAIPALLSYHFWDVSLAWYFRTAPDALLAFFQIVTQVGDSLWLYLIMVPVFLVYRFILKNEQWAANSLFLILSVSASGLVNLMFKWLAGRNRPILLFEEGLFGFEFFHTAISYDTMSFPSGHTVTAFAMAAALSYIFQRGQWVFFTAAAIVGLSRVVITAHYLSDVMAGAAVGVICCMGLKYAFDRAHIELKATGW